MVCMALTSPWKKFTWSEEMGISKCCCQFRNSLKNLSSLPLQLCILIPVTYTVHTSGLWHHTEIYFSGERCNHKLCNTTWYSYWKSDVAMIILCPPPPPGRECQWQWRHLRQLFDSLHWGWPTSYKVSRTLWWWWWLIDWWWCQFQINDLSRMMMRIGRGIQFSCKRFADFATAATQNKRCRGEKEKIEMILSFLFRNFYSKTEWPPVQAKVFKSI